MDWDSITPQQKADYINQDRFTGICSCGSTSFDFTPHKSIARCANKECRALWWCGIPRNAGHYGGRGFAAEYKVETINGGPVYSFANKGYERYSRED